MKYSLSLFLFLFCFFSGAQTLTRCEVYQFSGTDSMNGHISFVEVRDSLGKVLSETYSNFWQNSKEGYGDGTYSYVYKDTLLMERYFVNGKGDSTKILFRYNDKGQLWREEHFALEYKVTIIDLVDGTSLGSRANEKTWEKKSHISYNYDTLGNKVLYDAGELHFSTENRYTWKYDKKNRVVEYAAFNGEKLVRTWKYTYFKGGYKYTTLRYDKDGNPVKPKTEDSERDYTFTFYTDKKGRIIKEEVNVAKGAKIGTRIISYRPDGRINRTVYMNSKGDPEMTHVYKYY